MSHTSSVNTASGCRWVWAPLIALAATIASHAAWAQTAPSNPPPSPALPAYAMTGATLDGAPWSVAQAAGKVLMVFYFSTGCPVCMHKMPELRANAAGWRGKPFELVMVNTDAKREDALAYALAVRQVEPNAVRFTTLWAGDSQFRDTLAERPKKLPLTLVVDSQGKLAKRYEGRMAPEAWDDVADLLP